jgi:hypothetical protein
MDEITHITRRQFVLRAAVAGVALQAVAIVSAADAPTATHTESTTATTRTDGAIELRWLDGVAPSAFAGATCGVPWPRGALKAGQSLQLTSPDGTPLPVQTWPLAKWPDASI